MPPRRVRRDSGDDRLQSARPRIAERLAERQHGSVARWQLLRHGETVAAIDHRLRDGRWLSLHRGVYAPGHKRLTTHGFWMAAVLALGPGTLLSHRDAAALRDLRRNAREVIEVTTPGGGRSRQGIQVHRGVLHPDDIGVVDGIPVTSFARTLLDLAEVVSLHQLRLAWEQAERMNIIDMGPLNELIARSQGRRGLKNLLAVIALDPADDARVRSPLERRFREFLRCRGLPLPQPNVVLEGFEVDAHWPGTRLVAELDGYAYHRSPRSFHEDRRRTLVLQTRSYEVLRVSDRLLTGSGDLVCESVVRGLRGTRYEAALPARFRRNAS